jgi:hypothetical protein
MESGALLIYASTVNTIRSIILCSLSGTECPSSKASFVYSNEIRISVSGIGAVFARSYLDDIKAT